MLASRRRPASTLAWGLLAALATVPASCAKETGFKCQVNSDCNVGYYCDVDGTCQHQCVDASRDCKPGYTCDANGQCMPPNGMGGATSATGTTATNAVTTTNATTATNATNGPGVTSSNTTSTIASSTSSGTPTKILLDLCNGSSDCVSGLCLPMVKGGATRCTTSCTSDAGCPSGMRCDDAGGGNLVCLFSDIGRTCTDPSPCNFGCLTGPKYCTAKCMTGADCPNGWGCMMVSGQSVCVRAEAACSTTDTSACIVPAACQTTSTQLLVSSCTLACSSASDCPRRPSVLAQWTCDGLCERPADVYGPLPGGSTPTQYACNASSTVVNLCNDAQHIDFTQFTTPNPPAVNCAATTTTSGVAGDACLDSCRYQGGCINGFACAGLAAIASERVGLCMPAGAGEVGDACTHETDCVFGLCPSTNKCSRDCTADGVCPSGSTCVAAGGPAVEGAPFKRCQ